ncbi:ABC transporter permease subunit [Dactylosporangium aurantiacum]|uniref:ABC transporter permease subunit n=1 Tax=Dactylosporangium aurantiacum TaxID=35754 RepID=A0A9Q9IKP0_9ACTN|nr:ABC transporter permease subunit [Dactylosporangium aurantiacum]MDG6108489.1 ABC transporter permease subunit [Dactylosporangium aurantiacum]UWZ57331.1 ABC transporter permease subunit [Dactylosporangium aurantiacum]
MRLTFPRVLRAEWTKLLSLRSTWLTLGGLAVVTAGLAGAVGYGVHRSVVGGDAPPSVARAVGAGFLPVDFVVLVVGVFGVLQMTGEYGTGSIRSTLTAVPRRWPVVAAKALAQVAVTVPLMGAVCLGSFLVCQAFLGDDGASLADPHVPRAIAGAAAGLVLTGLLGLGVGTLLRHSAVAITTLVATMFVGPALLSAALPAERADDIMRFVPTVAAQAMYSVDGTGTPFRTFSPAGSAAVLTGWVVLLLLAGTLVLRRRDA